MKKHIVRAPQTDRYGLEVPTKLSELEDDLPGPALIAGLALATLASPSAGPSAFSTADAVITSRSGFAEPTGTNLTFVVPETGTYLVSAVFSWLSTTSSGSGVGRIVTPGTFELETILYTPVRAGIDGTYGRDNKLGPLVTDPGDIPVYISSSLLFALTAGDSISPTAEAVSIAADVKAVVEFSIVRVA